LRQLGRPGTLACVKTIPLVLGVLMFVVGGIWTLQGLGYLGGSPMTGSSVWAVLGPLVAGFGVALAFVSVRRPPGR
jgi:hypothetical protein